MAATKSKITIEQGANFSETLIVGTGLNGATGEGKIVDSFGGNVIGEFTVSTVAAGSTTISMVAADTAVLTPTREVSDIEREVPLGFYDIELTLGGVITRVREGVVVLSRRATV